jgi:tail lysozyme
MVASSCTAPAATETSEAALSSSEASAYDFFVSKGLTSVQSAGVVGNLIQESSVVPTAIEYDGGPGRGIAQWSVGGRWDTDSGDNLVTYASTHADDPWALDTQLDFIWYELASYSSYGLAELQASGNVTDATIAFQDRFEVCGTCDETTRIEYAEQVLGAYGDGSSGGGGSATCYSDTLGQDMPANACVQSEFDDLWYQCDDGAWVDRWSDPDACVGVYPL